MVLPLVRFDRSTQFRHYPLPGTGKIIERESNYLSIIISMLYPPSRSPDVDSVRTKEQGDEERVNFEGTPLGTINNYIYPGYSGDCESRVKFDGKIDMESGRIECLGKSSRVSDRDRIQIGSRSEKTGSKDNPIMLVFRTQGENIPPFSFVSRFKGNGCFSSTSESGDITGSKKLL